jgi:Tol biopolymer transport system component
MSGFTLHQLLEQKKPLPPERAVDLATRFLQSLGAAHRADKVYGAIYPDQILFQKDDVQILDLGAPRDPEDVTLTYLCFVPPELLDAGAGGKPAPTVEADLYSAGIVLYTLMAGRVPFSGDSREKIVEAIFQARTDPLPELKGSLSQVSWVLRKCLLSVPNRRFHSVDEMLKEFRDIRPREVRRSAAAESPGEWEGTPRSRKQAFAIANLWATHWKIISPAAGGAVLLLLVIFLIAHNSGSSPTRRAVRGSATALPFEWTSESSPTLSPDAKQVAYISDFSGRDELYVRPVGAKKGVALTNSPGREENPRWSPTGDNILYTYRDIGQPPALFSVPPDGGIPQRIVADAVDSQWSPDGRKVCYVSVDGEKRSLLILGLDDLKSQTVLDDAKGLANPSFSGDAEEIVYEADLDRGHGLVKIDIKSGEKQVLTTGPDDSQPVWDGKADVIYYSSKQGENAEIWSVDGDGAKKQITSGGNDFRPDVAFQKGSLVFYRMRMLSDIFIFDLQRKTNRNVSPLPGASSFPLSVAGGRWLAFLELDGGGTRLNLRSWSTSSTNTVIKQVPPGSTFSASQDGSSVYWEAPDRDLQQVVLTNGKSAGVGSSILLPYELSPNRKSLFFARRNKDQIDYVLRNLKDQQEDPLFSLPSKARILRAGWNQQGKSIYYVTADQRLSVFRLADRQSSVLLEPCFDFAVRPKTGTLAVLNGPDVKNARLLLLDPESGKRTPLMSFSEGGYALHLDWSSDGNAIYYDRMRPGPAILLIQ